MHDRWLFITAAVLVVVAAALSLAHALEMPGKMRLDKNTYLAVQKIYYPGFTIGGLAEPAAILTLLVLLVRAPAASTQFWWIAASLAALVICHAIYWLVTHPVNSYWTQDVQLAGPGAAFFSFFAGDVGGDWSRLRDVWEYSHFARAIATMLGFVSLLIAMTA